MHTPSTHYDAIIVGSGAGGSAAAYGLVNAGLRVLMIEKGSALPKDQRTLDVQRVVHEGAYKNHDRWRDGSGRDIIPEEYSNVGGKTKWYGAALLRYAPHEFAADTALRYPAWPIDHTALAPYYAAVEQRLGARTFACEADLRSIIERLDARGSGWTAAPLPLGLKPNIVANPMEARHFDGFASPSDFKGDAQTAFLTPLHSNPRFTLLAGEEVVELVSDMRLSTRVAGVRLRSGQTILARKVLLAAGALHSPRILQRYMESTGLHDTLPAYRNVGRNLRLHLLTAMVAVSPTRKTDLLRKTRVLLHDDFPHSSVQPLGFDGEFISTLIPKVVPRFIARQIGARAYGFFLQTEDSAHPDNRVYDDTQGTGVSQGLPTMDYEARRSPLALHEHRQLIRRFRGALAGIGLAAFAQRIDITGTAHASGTLMAGTDPRSSVVDAQGKVHGMESIYVVDGSVLPRSSRVNPSLSIFAWSLRVAELLAVSLQDEATAPTAVRAS